MTCWLFYLSLSVNICFTCFIHPIAKVSARFGLMNDAVGIVVGVDFHPLEFTRPQDDWRWNRQHEAWVRGHVRLNRMPRGVFVRFEHFQEDVGYGVGIVVLEPSNAHWVFLTHDENLARVPRKISMVRRQFALAPERVRTVQTAQGLTMDSGTMYLARPPGWSEAEHWLHVYVMLSRVRTLDQILIFGLPDRSLFAMGPPSWVTSGLAPFLQWADRDLPRAQAALARMGWVSPHEQFDEATATSPLRPSKVDEIALPILSGEGVPASASSESEPFLVAAPRPAWWLSAYDSATARSLPNLGEIHANLLRAVPDICAADFGVASRDCPNDLYFVDDLASEGITNHGNTCFVSAVLQVVLRVEVVANMLLIHHSDCMRDPGDCVWCCAAVQAAGLRRAFHVDSCPLALLARRGRFGAEFLGARRQADASDFFHNLLMALEAEEPRVLQRADPHFSTLYGHRSALREVAFGGVVRERRRCLQCSACVDAFTSCVSIILALPKDTANVKSITLRSLWESYFGEEPCDSDARCPGACGDCTKGSVRQVFLEKEPPFLVIVLRRAWESWHKVGKVSLQMTRGKSQVAVKFPRILDFMRSGSYSFLGVVRHIGESCGSGHYVATCSLGDDRFGHFDDSKRPIVMSWEEVSNAAAQREAYMLLYGRGADGIRKCADLPWSCP